MGQSNQLQAKKKQFNEYVKTKTAAYTLLPNTEDFGATFSNLGASGAVVLTLPIAAPGLMFDMKLEVAQNFSFTADSTSHFVDYWGTDTAAAASLTSGRIGNSITIFCDVALEWRVSMSAGEWLNYSYKALTATHSGTETAEAYMFRDKIIVSYLNLGSGETVTVATPTAFEVVDVHLMVHEGEQVASKTITVKNTAAAISGALAASTDKALIRTEVCDTTNSTFDAGDDDLVLTSSAHADGDGQIILNIVTPTGLFSHSA